MQRFTIEEVTYTINDHYLLLQTERIDSDLNRSTHAERFNIPESIRAVDGDNRAIVLDGRLFVNGFEFKDGKFDPYEKIKFWGCWVAVSFIFIIITIFK